MIYTPFFNVNVTVNISDVRDTESSPLRRRTIFRTLFRPILLLSFRECSVLIAFLIVTVKVSSCRVKEMSTVSFLSPYLKMFENKLSNMRLSIVLSL